MMLKKLNMLIGTVALAASFGVVSSAQAVPVNVDGNLVTPGVIFGSGNANGSWTGENKNGIEVGLRGKLRYNLSSQPENTFNYDGDRTYTFDPASGNPLANRSIFNFEFSINVDSSGSTGGTSTGNVLDDFTYRLDFDTDASAGTNFLSTDPVRLISDNAIGKNGTNGDIIAQNSENRGFGVVLGLIPFTFGDFSGGLNPQLEGLFTYNLLVLDGTNKTLASSSIDILVGAVPSVVPLPAALPLYGTGLAIMGFVGWRRRKATVTA